MPFNNLRLFSERFFAFIFVCTPLHAQARLQNVRAPVVYSHQPHRPSPKFGVSMSQLLNVQDERRLSHWLARLRRRNILFIGDSSLRHQFIQLTRILLRIPRNISLAKAVLSKQIDGKFFYPGWQQMNAEKPDSSNGFWGGFGYMAAVHSPDSVTLGYVKLWGCAGFEQTVNSFGKFLPKFGNEVGARLWPPETIVWNFGLHLLHVYPARPVATSAVMCALSYSTLVAWSAAKLRSMLPTARLVWRTTNSVCSARFSRDWAAAGRAYHCVGAQCAFPPNARILTLCMRRYNISIDECRKTFMDEQNTQRQHDDAVQALRNTSRAGPEKIIELLDAFATTRDHCDDTEDGRHYLPRVAIFNTELLKLISKEQNLNRTA
mmetsp:Transcript_57367/g.124654  ORF Transcript_57367/g.124654 Transcript_57367/m.124654 type:complete len:377 (-) Transcript_57367:135-1265(-)